MSSPTGQAVRGDYPSLDITRTLADRTAKKALTALSGHARLVVLGCDDVSRATALFVGSTPQAGGVTIPYLIDWDAVEDGYRRQLSEALAPWQERYPDVEVTADVDPSRPSRAILQRVDDAQLVVVGNRGRGAVAGTVLGSTGLNLLHHCAAPDMMCHPSDVDR